LLDKKLLIVAKPIQTKATKLIKTVKFIVASAKLLGKIFNLRWLSLKTKLINPSCRFCKF